MTLLFEHHQRDSRVRGGVECCPTLPAIMKPHGDNSPLLILEDCDDGIRAPRHGLGRAWPDNSCPDGERQGRPRACAGILRRALRRGKAIPEPLRSALEAQAGREWNQAMKRQEATMDKATEQATPAETGRPANGSAPATAKWAMRGLELITDNDGGSVTIRISMGGLGLPELLADLAGAGVA